MRSSHKFIGILAVSLTVGYPWTAAAQFVEGVVIDLSVISDGGIGQGSSSVAPLGTRARGKLQLPPTGKVRSRLYVQPKKRTAAAPKLRMKKAAVKTTPSVKVAVSPPLQPIRKPAAKPKVKMVKVAPPPKPKTLSKPAAAPAPPPAPKPAEKMPSKMAKAPPPPPKSSSAPPPPTAPAAQENASAPASITLKPGRAMRIAFSEQATKLPASAEANLNSLANAIRSDSAKSYRLQLMAYAGDQGLSSSKARRISLSRALAVRSFLIDKGVRSTQIDVRALGDKTSDKPANRVDINLARR
jgi:outer membrane protein OmpA-like peptidoglycan-associated protein